MRGRERETGSKVKMVLSTYDRIVKALRGLIESVESLGSVE